MRPPSAQTTCSVRPCTAMGCVPPGEPMAPGPATCASGLQGGVGGPAAVPLAAAKSRSTAALLPRRSIGCSVPGHEEDHPPLAAHLAEAGAVVDGAAHVTRAHV